jgi:hypothetical protein
MGSLTYSLFFFEWFLAPGYVKPSMDSVPHKDISIHRPDRQAREFEARSTNFETNPKFKCSHAQLIRSLYDVSMVHSPDG